MTTGDADVTTGIFDPRAKLIKGTDGDDVLTSRQDGATLKGGAGFDELIAGRGKDKMFGGADSDYFTFMSVKDAGKKKKADVIKDFTHDDRIGLYAIDANTKQDGFQQFKFIGAQKFHKKAGELHYVKAGKKHLIVEGDVNGDGKPISRSTSMA